MSFKTFRKWTLYLGGLIGFSVVGGADLFFDKDVNYAFYVLLGGMLGLDSVLNRDEKIKDKRQEETVTLP